MSERVFEQSKGRRVKKQLCATRYAEYAVPGEDAGRQTILRIDRVRILSDERTRI
jgi:hypothetical protein